ncbi:uncharacterized protein DS421_11g339510 [Arachis hypogaea]|nr:uncharacterized protein DS421_11g339510 [Arachis hypogaea]
MFTKILDGMSDWLDSIVLMCVTVADSEYCVRLKRFHRICSDRDEEKNYELVSSDPKERPGVTKKKASWISFRATQGKKVFSMYDESFRDFKNYYFKDPVVVKYSWESLSELEQAVVGVLEENGGGGEPPHLEMKRFLGDPSLLRVELDKMVKSTDSMKAFRRAKKATTVQNLSAKASGEGSSQVQQPTSNAFGSRKIITTPQVQTIPSDPVRPSSGAPTVAGPPPKCQKTAVSYDLNAKDFDGVGFATELIAPYGSILLDDVSILHHLDFIASSSIRVANVGAALSRVIKESPVRATKAFMEEAKAEFDRIKGLKDELDAKVTKLEMDMEREKSRATAAEAAANLAEEAAKKYKESYTRTYGELLEFKEKLESAQADYTELQGHLVGSVTDAYENLKAQVRVLAPELDLTLFSLDNVVEDGNIVPAPDDEDEGPPLVPPEKVATTSASSVPSEADQPESDPDVQFLNRSDGTVDAVSIATIPPAKDATTRENLDPL